MTIGLDKKTLLPAIWEKDLFMRVSRSGIVSLVTWF